MVASHGSPRRDPRHGSAYGDQQDTHECPPPWLAVPTHRGDSKRRRGHRENDARSPYRTKNPASAPPMSKMSADGPRKNSSDLISQYRGMPHGSGEGTDRCAHRSDTQPPGHSEGNYHIERRIACHRRHNATAALPGT